jgi:hypothetical protein
VLIVLKILEKIVLPSAMFLDRTSALIDSFLNNLALLENGDEMN